MSRRTANRCKCIGEGTSIGASTNIDGVYSVEVPNNNAVLEFSYVGYQKATLSLANASSYDVVMNEETRVLQEVVVTAMGISRSLKRLPMLPRLSRTRR